MSTDQNKPEPSIALPVTALVFSLLCFPVGLILSIVAMVKYGSARGTSARTLSLVALIVNCVLIVPNLGCMAAIAIPNFVKFECRSKQSEAKGNLKALWVAEEAHRAVSDAYSPDKAVIQFQPKGEKLRYQYAIVEATPTTFRAEALGATDRMEGDHWVINQAGRVSNVNNVCP